VLVRKSKPKLHVVALDARTRASFSLVGVTLAPTRDVANAGESATRYTWGMEIETEPYGGRLLAEIRKIKRLDLIVNKLDYQAIQKLKQADRDATLKMFYGSSYAFLQLIKTKEPAEVAQALVQAQQDDSAAVAAIMITVMAAQ